MPKRTETEINKCIDDFLRLEDEYIHLKHAQKIINKDIVDSLLACIDESSPLASFIEQNGLTRRTGTVIYKFFLKKLYSYDELVLYVKDALSKYIRSVDHLFPFLFDDAFIYIFGAKGVHLRKADDYYFKKVFDEGYSLLEKTEYWNTDIINQIVDSIKHNEDITSFLKPLDDFKRPNHYKIHLIDNYIIPGVGKDRFKEFTGFKAKEYYDGLNHDLAHKNVITYYFQYILGVNYDSSNPVFCSDSEAVNICYRSALKYLDDKIFNRIIAIKDLSLEEIQEIKNERKKYFFNKTLNYSSTLNPNELMHYGDVTINDVCNYIGKWFESFKSKERIPFKYSIFKNAIIEECTDELIRKNIQWAFYNHTNNEFKSYLSNCIQDKTNELKEYYFETNEQELSLSKDRYLLMYKDKDGLLRSETFDISSIKADEFKNSLRLYIKYNYQDKKLFFGEKRNKYFNLMVNFINYIEHQFRIREIKDISRVHIQAYLVYLSNIGKASATSIKLNLSAIRFFFDFVIEEMPLGINNNPAQTLTIKYPDEHLRNTPAIPEEILVYLDNHISEWPDKANSLIYEILSWTGFRFSDAKRLAVSGIQKISEELSLISVETSKTKTALIKSGMDYDISDYIPTSLYDKLEEYIKGTDARRKEYGTDLVFFRIVNGKTATLDDGDFIKSINSFLVSNNIKTLNNDYWNLTTRQPRKTVACTMINNGASISDVQHKLNHIGNKSTKKYYAEVNRQKLADLNHEFYKKKFGYLISEERLSLFSEEERRKLYEDFCLNSRITELGVCSLHPSEGRCDARINGSCATCPKICTGKQWLDKWAALRDDSLKYINELKRIYSENRISEDEYSGFIEYKQEVRLLDHYNAVIQSIEENHE